MISLLCLMSAPLAAQSVSAAPSVVASNTRQFETRAELEAQMRAAEQGRRSGEAFLLRSRLERGDFQEGDRIVVELEAGSTMLDTLQVRTGKVLQFPRMGELSLAGVLRSELTDAVRQYLAKYLTSPVVRATPLLPLAVFGNVQRPGYYYTPADVVLRDVIMNAGGPSPDADMNKIVIRRAGDVIWKADDVRIALTDGLALDGLHLRAGDEVFIAERRRFQMTSITTIATATVALVLAVIQITNTP